MHTKLFISAIFHAYIMLNKIEHVVIVLRSKGSPHWTNMKIQAKFFGLVLLQELMWSDIENTLCNSNFLPVSEIILFFSSLELC